jgi:hypothetical protein
MLVGQCGKREDCQAHGGANEYSNHGQFLNSSVSLAETPPARRMDAIKFRAILVKIVEACREVWQTRHISALAGPRC